MDNRTRFALASGLMLERNRSSLTATLLVAALGAAAAPGATDRATADYATTSNNGMVLFHNNGHLYTACPDGSALKLFEANVGLGTGDWSPDGERIVLQRRAPTEDRGVWVVDWDGSNAQKVPGPPVDPEGFHNHEASWAPDGRHLAFAASKKYPPYSSNGNDVSRTQPHKVDLVTGEVSALVDNREWSLAPADRRAAWHPDGSIVVRGQDLEHDSNGTTAHNIGAFYSIPSGGGAPTLITPLPDDPWEQYSSPDYRPDGDALLFSRHRVGAPELMLANRDGGSETPILTGDGVGKAWPSYSPDGEQIIYWTYQNENRLLIRNADGTGEAFDTGLRGSNADWGSKVADCDSGASPSYSGVRINEIMLSYDGSDLAQYIELLNDRDDNFLPEAAPYKLIAFDGDGNEVDEQVIANSALRNRDDTKPFLLRTGFFPSSGEISNFDPRDAVQSMFMPTDDGQLCFTATDSEQKVDCISWGCVASPVAPGIPNFGAPPDSESSQRQGITSEVFHTADPTPRETNVAGTASPACGADTTSPALRLFGRDTQSSDKQVTVKVEVDEAAAIVVKSKGKAIVKSKGRTKVRLPMTRARATLDSAGKAKLTLKFKGRETKLFVERALRKGWTITLKLEATATDEAGNNSTDRFKVTLKR